MTTKSKLPFITPIPIDENELQKARKFFRACQHKNKRKITQRSIFFVDIVCDDCEEFIERKWYK